jgi:ApaG protein
MYEATTHKIRVRVEPRFLEDQSAPENDHYFWAYTIEITNTGVDTVQLVSRAWQITDAKGRLETVRGPGVVGEKPVLKPGQSFTYSSGCPLGTPSGLMVGTYQMTRVGGLPFEIKVPAFSLDSPYAVRIMN